MTMLRLLTLSFLIGSHAARVPRVTETSRRQSDGVELATYDDACNIGYCSVMGATIGGWGGNYTKVSTFSDFASMVSSPGPGVIIVEGNLSSQGDVVKVGSGKTVIGSPGSSLSGIRLHLDGTRNVILRNLKIVAGPETQGQAIVIEGSRSVWIDHCDLSSTGHDQESLPKALVSITHGSDFSTVTATLFHDHPQAIVVGDSDADAENRDKFRLTFARNYLRRLGSGISFSFGTGHIFNNYFEDVVDGIYTKLGAKLLIESTVWKGSRRAVFSEGSDEPGSATVRDVILNKATNTAPVNDLTTESIMYPYDWYIWEVSSVQASVVRQAGQLLEFLEPFWP